MIASPVVLLMRRFGVYVCLFVLLFLSDRTGVGLFALSRVCNPYSAALGVRIPW